MCDPVTAVLALSATSAVLAGGSAIASGSYQQSQSNYQAQVARNNAVIQDQNARTATLAGEEQQQQSGFKTAAMIGAQRTAFAASGIDPNSGSALDIQTDQAKKGMLDQLTIVNNAARQSYGYNLASISDNSQAELDQANGNMQMDAGLMSGFGSILSGASSVGGKYLAFQQSGTGGGGGVNRVNGGMGGLY